MAEVSNPRSNSANGEGSSWWTSIKQSLAPKSSSRSYNDLDEEDEPLLSGNSGMSKRRKLRTGWEQIAAYLVLLTLGLVVGGVIGRRYFPSKQGKGHGPMVAPVWTLPPPSDRPRNLAYLVDGHTGAVAAEDETCSNLGLSILRDHNGTAVDAAVTTTLCIGLLNAFSSGIGGGGFMVIRVPEGPFREGLEDEFKENGLVAIDFRETSPQESDKEMYGVKKAGRSAAQVGGLAVGVPGELRGLELAHSLYGSLSWEEVVMPVAKLARGWQVSRSLAGRIRVFGQFMLNEPTWSEIYAPHGYLAVEGDWIKRSAYGRTLETVAKHGADAFYNGKIAKQMIRKLDSVGGVMTLDDLHGYKALAYPPIHQVWNNKTVYTTSAPSSGAMLLAILNILEDYDFPSTPESEGGCNGPLNTHRLLEAMKFAFGARSEVTDPAFATAKQRDRYMEFSTKKWAKEAREKITNGTHDADYYGLHTDAPADHGTTHLSVLDQWGGAASITSTVNLIWGSHVMDNETGVIFNDEQDDFSIPGAADAFGLWPSPWNYPAPGKKPLSSTAASIILNADGSINMVLGGSGGSRIFPSLASVLLNLQCGLNLSEAVERPRVHNQIVPNLTTLEVGPEGVVGEWKDLVKGLEDRGHKVGLFDINIAISEVQAILVDNGTIWATSDSRKYGVAAAY